MPAIFFVQKLRTACGRGALGSVDIVCGGGGFLGGERETVEWFRSSGTRTARSMDGWIDGWIDAHTHIHLYKHNYTYICVYMKTRHKTTTDGPIVVTTRILTAVADRTTIWARNPVLVGLLCWFGWLVGWLVVVMLVMCEYRTQKELHCMHTAAPPPPHTHTHPSAPSVARRPAPAASPSSPAP